MSGVLRDFFSLSLSLSPRILYDFSPHNPSSYRHHISQHLLPKSVSQSIILLLTISQSVYPSWPLVRNCDSWPYFSLEKKVRYCLSWAGHSLCLCCVYVDTHVWMSDPVLISSLLLLLVLLLIYCRRMKRSLVTADQAGQSDVWSWCRAPSGTPDQMFASLTFTFLSLVGVIPAPMRGLTFLNVLADFSLFRSSNASNFLLPKIRLSIVY
jgi:hypothetical protein